MGLAGQRLLRRAKRAADDSDANRPRWRNQAGAASEI